MVTRRRLLPPRAQAGAHHGSSFAGRPRLMAALAAASAHCGAIHSGLIAAVTFPRLIMVYSFQFQLLIGARSAFPFFSCFFGFHGSTVGK